MSEPEAPAYAQSVRPDEIVAQRAKGWPDREQAKSLYRRYRDAVSRLEACPSPPPTEDGDPR